MASSFVKGIGLVAAGAILLSLGVVATKRQSTAPTVHRLHSGWGSYEHPGTIKLNDLPVGSAISPDGSLLAVIQAGEGAHAVSLFDNATGELLGNQALDHAWSGITFTEDGSRVVVSGGTRNVLHLVPVSGRALGSPTKLTMQIEKRAEDSQARWLAGLIQIPGTQEILVASSRDDELIRVNLETGACVVVTKFPVEATPTEIILSPDRQSVAVTLQGSRRVAMLSLATFAEEWNTEVGRHPNALTFVGNRLFVTCANDDTVVALSPNGDLQEKINVRPYPTGVAGSTPNALVASKDGKTLFVANADNNMVAVLDIEAPRATKIKGFLPTGWYPCRLGVSVAGDRLFVMTGKGQTSLGPNDDHQGKFDPIAPKGYPHIKEILSGTFVSLAMPKPGDLKGWTDKAFALMPYNQSLELKPILAPAAGTNPIPSKVGDDSPIEHVLYIIKENRTYDQLFGDMTDASGKPIGNGDPSLTIFGEKVSPNHHALAREFVLLDNTYCLGEVSVDGHHWTNGAYVPSFMQRTWPQQYSAGRGAPRLTPELSETPNGRIWTHLENHKVPFRTYYYHTTANRNEDWHNARRAGRRDYDYVDVFIDEFKKYEQEGTMPKAMVMALSEDHTKGTTPGAFTPQACVGSNDLGLGKIVDAISHSTYWKKFAIFVIEDDAQNGPDHVDAHRTVALVISPYTKRKVVDSTHYTSASMLRTIELILGLPPMSQVDAAATPLYNAFTMKPDFTAYKVRPSQIDLEAKNPSNAVMAEYCKTLDFSEPDLLTLEDEHRLNEAIWYSVHPNRAYPGVVRSFGPWVGEEDGED